MQQSSLLNRVRRRVRGGFTLIEVAIAIVIIAVGVLAVQAMVASSTSVTSASNELQTSVMLVRAMHERCLGLDRAALLALNGKTFSPPLDSQARALTELPNYAQRIDIQYVDPEAITNTSPDETSLLRVIVTVSRNGQPVLNTARLIATTKQE